MRISNLLLLVTILLVGLFSCQQGSKTLPIVGNRDIVNGDTIYPQIRDFQFINQDSQLITNADFPAAYVVDFFFTSCPTICPTMTKQLKRVHDHYLEEDRIKILSHTVDIKYDTIPALKRYAEKLGVFAPKWNFVTGSKDSIYEIAADYYSIATENPDAPGGYDHSGRLILVDSNRHVRAFCDGTDPKAVDSFIQQIQYLLNEMDHQ